jgi:hypothetical protein
MVLFVSIFIAMFTSCGAPPDTNSTQSTLPNSANAREADLVMREATVATREAELSTREATLATREVVVVTREANVVIEPSTEPAPENPLQQAIIGQWEEVSGPDFFLTRGEVPGTLIEFFVDGTVSVTDVVGGSCCWAGEYTWVDNTHVKISVAFPFVSTVSINGDTLTLTTADDQMLVLKRRQ